MSNPFLTDSGTVVPLKDLQLTKSAADRCQKLLQDSQKQKPQQKVFILRVKVVGGGCSGLQYLFDEETIIAKDDRVVTKGNVQLVCDRQSLERIGGSVVDFVDSLHGSYFTLKNPKAKASCGCGTSFSV